MIDPEQQEAAKLLRVHHRTVLLWIDEGLLAASRPAHKYLISGRDIQALISESVTKVY